METKRIDFVDLAKGICILLVVLYHINVPIPYMELASCFRMPLYFILSGLFFKDYGGFKFFLVKKTNKLAIPWLFFYTFYAALFPLYFFLYGVLFKDLSGFKYLCANIKFRLAIPSIFFYTFGAIVIAAFLYIAFPFRYEELLSGAGKFLSFYYEKPHRLPVSIWFLLCLFILNLLFYVVFAISKRISTLFSKTNSSRPFVISLISLSLIIGCFGYYLDIIHVNLYMHIDSALTVMPFFCFGFLLRKYTDVLYPNRFDKYNFLFIIIAFVLIYLIGHFKSSYRYNSYQVPLVILYFTGIIGTVAILFIAKYIKKLPVISYIGRYSIIVLCTHEFIIITTRTLLNATHIDLNNFLRLIVILTIVIAIETIIVIPFMIKYMPHVTAQKDIVVLKQ